MKATSNRPERDSNFELLRIVAMLFIVLWHVMVHGTPDRFSTCNTLGAFTVTGVDIFVLISGYFGINLTFKRFANLYLTVFFYAILSIAVLALLSKPISYVDFISAFFIMSSGSYWFIGCYMMLMLISPALNVMIGRMNTACYVFTLLAMSYISFVTGFVFGSSLNPNGHTLFQFVFMYMIGNGIRRYRITEINKCVWVFTYLISSILIMSICLLNVFKAYAYNDPFVILSAIALLCLFSKIRIKNKVVNWIASCMFAVYLLQDGKIRNIGYDFLRENYQTSGSTAEWLCIVLFYIIVLFGTTFVIECIRRPICRPILAFSQKIWDRLISKLPDKLGIIN